MSKLKKLAYRNFFPVRCCIMEPLIGLISGKSCARKRIRRHKRLVFFYVDAIRERGGAREGGSRKGGVSIVTLIAFEFNA